MGLYQTFKNYNCRTAEINPLVLTKDGKIIAGDCRIAIDDSSVFRHPEFGIEVAREAPTPPRNWTRSPGGSRRGTSGGPVILPRWSRRSKDRILWATTASAAAGAILGVDALNREGLKIANYADTSGNPTAAKVYRAAKVIFSQPGIEAYFLGGFMWPTRNSGTMPMGS